MKKHGAQDKQCQKGPSTQALKCAAGRIARENKREWENLAGVKKLRAVERLKRQLE
jgi:hypothetical protein